MEFLKNPLVYVTRDKERAEGMPENSMYSIIAGDGSIDTLGLLSRPETAEIIESKKASIIVFKNSKQIEALVKEKGWKILNPPAELAEKVENKVTQVGWLGDLASLLPPHRISLVKKITREISDSSVIQWAHSHTGEGTIHIRKESELKSLQEKFPEREARVTTYIKGPVFTVNIVVASDRILVGNVSYQITGIAPFTENPFSTIGNDWSIPQNILSESLFEELNQMALLVGEKLKKDGWRGLFGIDIVYDEERDKLFLIEINARQPASSTYESQLQMAARNKGVQGMTLFEAHLAALTGTPVDMPLIEINDGAQIVQRLTSNARHIDTSGLEKAGYTVTAYKNTKPNSELLRIRSARGIMETHNKFNARGNEIQQILM